MDLDISSLSSSSQALILLASVHPLRSVLLYHPVNLELGNSLLNHFIQSLKHYGTLRFLLLTYPGNKSISHYFRHHIWSTLTFICAITLFAKLSLRQDTNNHYLLFFLSKCQVVCINRRTNILEIWMESRRHTISSNFVCFCHPNDLLMIPKNIPFGDEQSVETP